MANQNSNTEEQEQVIELLHETYWAEWEAVLNYISMASQLESVAGSVVANELVKTAINKTGHTQELADRINTLKEISFGYPVFSHNTDSLQLSDTTTTNVENVLNEIIDTEEEFVKLYEELAETANEADNRFTRDIANEILQTEQKHLERFKTYRQEYHSLN